MAAETIAEKKISPIIVACYILPGCKVPVDLMSQGGPLVGLLEYVWQSG